MDLAGVCFQESQIPNPTQNLCYTSILKEGFDTLLINKKNIHTTFRTWLTHKKPDLVLVCGFSIKIPQEILFIPTYGFLNIHFGKLPENRGPDPLFWSIKNGDTQTAITVHKMDKDWDSGAILIEELISITPGETMGILNSKMSHILGELGLKIIDLIKTSDSLKPQSTNEAQYYKKPTPNDLIINWEEQSADEIENLINACNPKYGGATTYYQGAPIKILEVSPANAANDVIDKTPGEIVHAHPQEGLFVYCTYGNLLRINTISSDAGILSGQKYIYLGVQQGHRFTSQPEEISLIKKQLNY